VANDMRAAGEKSMPSLTRRRSPDAELETWMVQYADVQVGTRHPFI